MEGWAVVVLGCALRVGAEGALTGAAARRAAAGARAFGERGGAEGIVVVSGGRAWEGVLEADGLARELVRLGVRDACIVREGKSLTTRENARCTAAVLAAREIRRAVVVTCAWHLPRAVALFRREGLVVEGYAAVPPPASLVTRAWRWGRERVAARLDGVTT